MPDAIFLGLVTHPATRFTRAASPEGLLPKLQTLLTTQGTQAQLSIHATDEWTEKILRIDRAVVEASIDAELAIEKRWRRYVDPSVPKLFLDAFMGIRRIYRRGKFLPRGGRELRSDDPGFRMVRRLVNIEIAHMSLLRQAAHSGSEWTLIAEDDATSSDPSALAQSIGTFISEQTRSTQPKYVNISRSFNHRRLRVRDLLQPIKTWGPSASNIEALQASRPITNTVCAILYRTDFLATLVHTMEAIPLEPVVPIDWKLNNAIMQLHDSGELTSGDCWTLDPAPIVQSSMVDSR